jgi:hypothetical protein
VVTSAVGAGPSDEEGGGTLDLRGSVEGGGAPTVGAATWLCRGDADGGGSGRVPRFLKLNPARGRGGEGAGEGEGGEGKVDAALRVVADGGGGMGPPRVA